MILEHEQAAFPGGYYRSAPVDLRSRRLKAVVLPSDWNAATVTFRPIDVNDDTLTSSTKYVNGAGTEVALTGTAGDLILVAPDDIEGLGWVLFQSGSSASPVAQGTPAGFAVIPNTEDFSAGDPVTFTLTISDQGDTVYDVVLDADYTDVDGLVTELQSQAPLIDWSNNAGALTADYVGSLGSFVNVTDIVDADDKMNFSSIIEFAFPGYATDALLSIITEPRT